LNGTHHLLVYANDNNLLGDNMNTINIKTEALIDASKEVGTEANTEKTKYMSMSRHQSVGQNHNINTDSRSFENLSKF
jgi:hypothetical protein